jgi:hypothetical protein
MARQPGFVVIRVARRIRATLLGLVPSVLRTTVERVANQAGARPSYLLPTCRWLPKVLRLESDDLDLVTRLSLTHGLGPPQWLMWPTLGPSGLELDSRQQALREGAAPESFEIEARWDWEEARFVHPAEEAQNPARSGVTIEARTHREHCRVYVVVVDGNDHAWTYIRNWALLLAHSLADSPTFEANADSPLARRGGGVYLPLPVGQLCAVLGDGLSGPKLGEETWEYVYPLGQSYREAMEAALPCCGIEGART